MVPRNRVFSLLMSFLNLKQVGITMSVSYYLSICLCIPLHWFVCASNCESSTIRVAKAHRYYNWRQRFACCIPCWCCIRRQILGNGVWGFVQGFIRGFIGGGSFKEVAWRRWHLTGSAPSFVREGIWCRRICLRINRDIVWLLVSIWFIFDVHLRIIII